MKKLISAAASCMLLLSSSVALAANTPTFSDVNATDHAWAYDAIESFVEQGIIEGNGDGTFDPNGTVTREQFAKMLTLSFGEQPQTDVRPTFSDVPADRWSFGYIEAGKAYLPGYEAADGGQMTFKPTQLAAREDIAAAVVRIMAYEVSDTAGDYAQAAFADYAGISSALRPYVGVAAEKGLIQGYPDGTFRPQAGITRAEAVVMLSRAMEQTAGKPTAVPVITLAEYPETVRQSTITLTGTVTDASTLTANGAQVAIAANGSFSATVELHTGKNTITLVATHQNGKTTRRVCTVTYTKPSYIDDGNRYWAYMTSDSYTERQNGDDTTAYEVWTGTEYTTLHVDGVGEQKRAGQIIRYLYAGDYIELISLPDEAVHAVAIVGVEKKQEGAIAFKGATLSGTYTMAEDCVYIAIDDSEQKGMDGGSVDQLALAEQKADGSYYLNAYVIGNSSGEIRAIIYDADNNRLNGDRTVANN